MRAQGHRPSEESSSRSEGQASRTTVGSDAHILRQIAMDRAGPLTSLGTTPEVSQGVSQAYGHPRCSTDGDGIP